MAQAGVMAMVLTSPRQHPSQQLQQQQQQQQQQQMLHLAALMA